MVIPKSILTIPIFNFLIRNKLDATALVLKINANLEIFNRISSN